MTATDSPAASAAVAPATATGSRGHLHKLGHLHQIDVVRLLTFGAVIGVHAVSLTNPGSSVPAGAALVLLHATREAFFLLSAFVLVYAQGSKDVRARSFWSRRFLPIGVPYVVWSVGYSLLALGVAAFSLSGLRSLGVAVATGTAEYHLYFLLVSMQLYLVFPALLRLVRRTAGHHLALFLVSLVIEVATLSLLQWTHAGGGFWGGLQDRAYVLLPTYQFYFVAGALAAVHHERFSRWVVAHRAAVATAVGVSALLAEGAYAVQLLAGLSPGSASAPLQPVLIVWSLAATVGSYAVGCGYAERRRAGRLPSVVGRAVAAGSLASFGVYLIHPLVLDQVLVRWLQPAGVPAPLSTLLAWLCTLVLSFGLAALVLRTPAAYPLTGRRRLRAAVPEPAR